MAQPEPSDEQMEVAQREPHTAEMDPDELPEEDDIKKRTNGFERPFHPLQVLAWVVFGADVAVYVVFGLPLVGEDGTRTAVALLFAASVFVLVAAAYRATACDPSDPNVHLPPNISEETDSMPFCAMCNVPVFARSKHCRACNKCVDVFDHHCMWLNNCVGGQNYYSFLVTVSSVSLMIGVMLGTCVYLLVDILTNEEDFEQRLQGVAFMADLPREFFLAVLVTLIAVNAPLFLLDSQLVLLHIFLASQQLTTYEYIMNKRSLESEEAEAEAEAEAAEAEAEAEAEQEGRRQGGSADEAPRDGAGAGRGGGHPGGRPGGGRGPQGGRRVRTLPHWMDWIVFSRCGKKRRRNKSDEKTAVERIGSPEDTDPEAEREEQAVSGGPVNVASPPGSTEGALDGSGGPSTSAGGASTTEAGGRQAGGGGAGSSAACRTNDANAPSPAVPAAVAHHPGAASGGLGPAGAEAKDLRIIDNETTSSKADSPQVLVAERLGCGCDKAGAVKQLERPSPAKL